MIQLDRNKYREYKEGIISPQELADYLLRTYPASEIALALVETLDIEDKPIVISQEDFNRHFRIKGIRADGTLERRGYHKKIKDREI